jgi:hypothetical protein
VAPVTFRVQSIANVFQSASDIAPHHAGAYPHALGYFFDLDLVYPMEQKCLPALRRELGYRNSKRSQGLFSRHLTFGGELKHGKIDLGHGGHLRASTALAQAVDRQIGGRLEQEGTKVTHGLRVIQLQQMDIRFLRDLPGLLLRANFCRDESQQRGVVLPKQAFDIDGLNA